MRVKLCVQLRRLRISRANPFHVKGESRVILFLGIEPVPDAMRFEVRFVEQPTKVPGRDRRDDATLLDLSGQFRMGPGGDWTARLFGRLAGHRTDLGQLFGSELAGSARACRVGEQLADRLTQCGRLLQTLDHDETIKGSGPACPPDANLMTFQLDLRSDLFVEQAREGEQDKRRTVSEKGRLTTRAAELVQNLLLSFGDDDLGGLPWHGCFSSHSGKNFNSVNKSR